MKNKSVLLRFVLVTAISLTICGTILVVSANTPLLNVKNVNASDSGILLPGGDNASETEFWENGEYERWMEQQRAENQKLADSGDKSFYEKDANGTYVCREWTQEDVDSLYAEWQEQLTLMKQGYHFTKSINLPDGGVLAGAVDPETWNANPSTAPGSAIITLPDGSTVDLGHFDTAGEAAKVIEKYLKQEVADGKLTQQEADTILAHGAIK